MFEYIIFNINTAIETKQVQQLVRNVFILKFHFIDCVEIIFLNFDNHAIIQ